MSSPITPPPAPAAQPVRHTTAVRPTTGPHGTGAPFALEPTVSLDTLPASPPPEVLDQMASAAQTHKALLAQGRELRFARDERNGRVEIEVRDQNGRVLKTITPAQALAIAAGAPLE